jgi:hypothetical protein
MSQLETPDTPGHRFRIDKDYLMRQLPSLVDVARKRRSWDEHGEKVARDHLTGRRPLCRVDRGLSGCEVLIWSRAKALAYAVIVSNDPAHAAIRKQLGDWQNRSTAALLSTLGLWMAGVLGVSITVISPMLVTMLYGVAEAGEDWEVLRGAGRDGDATATLTRQ